MNSRLLLTLLLGAAATLSVPALADTRDDVLGASQRCAAIADDRVWLDCYYGAAQPMRSRLGLPPAPASQLRVVPGIGAAPVYAPLPAYPQQAYPQQGQPAYGISVNGTANVAPAPAAAPHVTPDGLPPPPRRKTGFLAAMFGDSKPIVSNLRMAAYTLSKNGQPFSVTLSDGEIWEEAPGNDAPPPFWHGQPSRYVVNITQGASGTYNMTISDDPYTYKVRRVK